MSRSRPRSRNPSSRRTAGGRIRTLSIVLGVFGVLVVGRLAQVQVIEHGRWTAAARAMQERTIELLPRRGTIYDRNGVSLAFDVKAVAIAVDSLNMTKPETLVKILAEELKTPVSSIEELIYQPKYFTWIDRKVDLEAAQRIEEKARAASAYGLIFIDAWKRCYPQGDLASNVIGFVGLDGHGLEGIELQFDQALGGTAATVQVVVGADGRTYHTETSDTGTPGQDLHLTLDSRLQLLCEEEIDRGVARYKPNAGYILLLDPQNGDVLAMAQNRRYDLNRFQSSTVAARKNLALTHLFEPGSSFKAITGLAALDSGAVTPEDRFNGNDGLTLYGHTYHNSEEHSYGTVSFAEVIAQSVNTGMIRAAQKLGEERMYQSLVSLGFGKKTGITLPGEESGTLADLADWSGLSLASAAIGQGVAVTGIQLARAMAVVANDGLLLAPRIVLAPDAKGRPNDDPVVLGRVAGERACTQMRAMLRRVVTEGTGTLADVPNFAAAGKTGTAQKAFPGRGYADGKYTSLFIGFLPVDQPEYLLLVVLDEVKVGSIFGGSTAAPIFSLAASRIVKLEHVAPVATR